MTTHSLRENFNLTQKDLSDLFSIPLATVKNWDARNSMPSYVFNMIYLYFHQQEIIAEKDKEILDLKFPSF